MRVANGRVFERVLILMFENQYRAYIMANPYFRGLAQQGIDMAAYIGVMHPSQTNYIASIAGELCNVTDDEAPPPLKQRTIVDLIEESPHGLSWKAYMDSYISQNNRWTTPGFKPEDEYPYVIKHNPFSSFANIQGSRERWERIVDEAELFKDLLNGTLPQYCWFTPNMWNDGHYLDGTKEEPADRAPGLVDQAAVWLEGFFGALRFPGPDSHLPEGTLVVVTFDESDFEAKWEVGAKYTYDGPNQIYTVLLGDMIEPGVEHDGYNHYSLIRTIEENFGLEKLGKNDTHAAWFQFLWGQRFDWNAPQETPIVASRGLASAGFHDALHVVFASDDGLGMRTFDGEAWSPEQSIGVKTAGKAALAAIDDELYCVYQTEKRRLACVKYTLAGGWSAESTALVDSPVEELALSAFGDASDQLMCVWREEGGEIGSLRLADGAWEETSVDTGHATDGTLSLGSIGASLFLVFKTPSSDRMMVVSYNAAHYNVVEVPEGEYSGPYNNTSVNAWSPSAFPVADFSSAPFEGTPGEAEPITEPYSAGGPLVMATLDGVIHLAHPGPHSRLILEESFSIAGILTPVLPVSYRSTDKKTTSNGYGTLAEAGWTEQSPINGTSLAADGVLAMASTSDGLTILYQADEGGRVRLCRGRYG